MSLDAADLPQRVAAKIAPEPMSGCWLWTGAITSKGYGNLGGRGWNACAHRLVYELLVGSIPDGLELDHLCRNRACVSPWHLEPVTHLVNTQRGEAGARMSARTHCPQGHLYDEANTYVRPSGRTRDCRVCSRAAVARYKARRTCP